jgi:hypothetical protein
MDREELEAPSWDHRTIQMEHPSLSFEEWITLPATPSHSLDWSVEIAKGQKLVEAGKKIVWKFDLGLEEPFYLLEEEMRFQSAALALKQFTDSVWPQFKENTLALSLYRGSADFAAHFRWSEKQTSNFSIWLEEHERIDSPQARRLFAADAFAIYFQMLSHRLPDEVPIFLLFDLRSFNSPSEALQIISKERFEHFLVALQDRNLPLDGFIWNDAGVQSRQIKSLQGLVFPESSSDRFDSLLGRYPKAKIVFEAFLIDEWEGLDQLIVLEGSLGMQGARKLKGFEAAGGEVLSIIGE